MNLSWWKGYYGEIIRVNMTRHIYLFIYLQHRTDFCVFDKREMRSSHNLKRLRDIHDSLSTGRSCLYMGYHQPSNQARTIVDGDLACINDQNMADILAGISQLSHIAEGE